MLMKVPPGEAIRLFPERNRWIVNGDGWVNCLEGKKKGKRQKVKGKRKKSKGKRQKAKGKRQKAKGKR